MSSGIGIGVGVGGSVVVSFGVDSVVDSWLCVCVWAGVGERVCVGVGADWGVGLGLL